MTWAPIRARTDRIVSRPAARDVARSAAEAHPRYEPRNPDSDAQQGARNPCFD
jgi:hypothetical protein